MSLVPKQQSFARLVARFILELSEMGIYVTLGEAYRTKEQADIYAKTGQGIANSLHCIRLAMDLNLFTDSQNLANYAAYEKAGQLWESYSTEELTCAWGGRFSPPDSNHFSVVHDGRR